jgi:hypothetical protein
MGMVEKHNIKITSDLRGTLISITGVPTTPTAYAHGYGKVPSFVFITHTLAGTTGVVLEVKTSRNASSISLQGSISGIGADVLVLP